MAGNTGGYGGITTKDLTGTYNVAQTATDPVDSQGDSPNQLFDQLKGDTGGLPSRVEELEDTQADLETYVSLLKIQQKTFEEDISRIEAEIEEVSEFSDDLSSLETQVESEIEALKKTMNQGQSVSDLSENIFKTISGTGAVLTVITAAIWATLAPSLLVLMLVIPVAFFTYSYVRGTNVINE